MSNVKKTPAVSALRTIRPAFAHPLPLTVGPGYSYRSWIDLPGSMTRALGEARGGTPAVTPVYEGPGRPARWEARLLATGRRRAYVREVDLSVAGSRMVSARTLSLLEDPAVEVLRRLSDRPLAEVLFQNSDWQRLTPPIPLLDTGARRVGRACVWGYHTRGRRLPGGRGSRILVTEYFETPLAGG